MPTFREKYASRARDLRRDLTKARVYAGFEVIKVPGHRLLDTNYVGKAEHALFALKTKDFVYLHVEARMKQDTPVM